MTFDTIALSPTSPRRSPSCGYEGAIESLASTLTPYICAETQSRAEHEVARADMRRAETHALEALSVSLSVAKAP